MTFLKNIALVCLLVCVSYSCHVEKRLYRKGYSVVWNHKRAKNVEFITPTQKQQSAVQAPVGADVVVVSSTDELNHISSAERKLPEVFRKDTCGDVIYLKNGEKIIVKVLEVDRGVIKYKRCDNLDGPLFTVRKSSLAMLQYYNGIKEDLEFEAQSPDYSQPKKAEPKKQNGNGLAAFICAILGFFLAFTFLAAIPLAYISLKQFKREPDKYTDKWMPRTALIICAVLFGLLALIIGGIAASIADTGILIAAVFFLLLAIISVVPLVSPRYN